MDSFALTSQPQGTCLTLALQGEVDIHTAPRLTDAARIDSSHELVVVDLTRVTFMDSSGLRALLGAEQRCERAGARLVVLCDEDGPVRRLFEIAGLGDWPALAGGRPPRVAQPL